MPRGAIKRVPYPYPRISPIPVITRVADDKVTGEPWEISRTLPQGFNSFVHGVLDPTVDAE
ncbi:hypothetical protein P5673_028857 [Acropora cervicornis]|uniref:Uncharacterized protein n=1 Tax=Acropora cervicornis TaxID=6130 RepID=A0AAD9PX69_ACRCE|nr:hypothetical protein P5673_028857 [Acropora cervicornis]